MSEISKRCIDFIESWESFRSHAYQDSGGVWTIGYGTVEYPDGKKVEQHHSCTIQQAEIWLLHEVTKKANAIKHLLGAYPYTQNQFEAILSLCYNIGVGAFAESTLLRKFKINPWDETIYKYKVNSEGTPIVGSCEFCRWAYCEARFVQGLLNRRVAESNYYANPIVENSKLAIQHIIEKAASDINSLTDNSENTQKIKAIAQTGLETALTSISILK